MKTILALALLAPALLPAQGIPDTGNSKLWQMRKKVQRRSAQRAGSYLDQMNQALDTGDAADAESALKAAIAQGTLTQPQIDDARGRIAALVSRQQQEMVAEARAKTEAESRLAAAQREAEAPARGTESAASRMSQTQMPEASSSGRRSDASSSTAAKTTEEQRFAATYAGGYHDFTCTRDTNAGEGNLRPWLTLRASNGKQWAVQYSVPLFFNPNKNGTGLTTDDRQNLEGTTMNVSFNQAGKPTNIKNTSNGKHCEVIDWKVAGYGW